MEGRYTATSGDLHQSNLKKEERSIISPSQMIKHASLTSTYFARKTKLFIPMQYEAWVNTQLSAKIKILHSDKGGEYLASDFVAHLKSKGTISKLTTHNTLQHNGVAERHN